MCTVLLTYDDGNVKARQSLSALLSTGLFMLQNVTAEGVDIDELNIAEPQGREKVVLENFMQGVRERMPGRNMSLDEACGVALRELRSLYDSIGSL